MAARAARKALVFVYGSLKTNFRNHYKMTGAQYVTSAVTKEAYPLVIFGERRVPYLLPFPGVGKNIRGELYSCEDDKLEELDRFERCHVGYYRRHSVAVQTDEGQTLECYAYLKSENGVTNELLAQPHLDEFTFQHNFEYTPSTKSRATA